MPQPSVGNSVKSMTDNSISHERDSLSIQNLKIGGVSPGTLRA
jgi:hypothetical protein